MEPPQRQGAGPQNDACAPIVAFDFDGTLTVRDSFVAYLRWRTDAKGWMTGLARLAPHLLAYLADRDRGRLKGAAVRIFLQGLARDRLEQEAQAFAAATFNRLMRPDALSAWSDRAHGVVRRVIVTASPEELVAPFAVRLGADELIGSRLRWTPEGLVGDGLEGPNCRGAEKVRRLRARYGPRLDVQEAFGDTAGDREMLALARRGHMKAFTGRPGRSSAETASSLQRRRK